MNRDLRRAQHTLTEGVIRRFWKAMTLSFPSLCVHDGVSLDYHQPFTASKAEYLADRLLKCHNTHVACPLFQYEYDPPNATPHHVSALTLTQMPSGQQVLSLFDPKGKGTERPREETLLMSILSKLIEQKSGRPTHYKLYDGKNLQSHDDIGLCQMFSLFYLYEYITEVTKLNPPSWRLVSDPNRFAAFIEQKRQGFNERTLHGFWQAYFQALQKQHQK